MAKSEHYCAEQIRAWEGETFLAVAEAAGMRLDPQFLLSRQRGKALRLADLFSVVRVNGVSRFRIREVKFKLEDRLVRKALTQLEIGARQLLAKDPTREIDRLEIVIPLQGRELKEGERHFLGKALSSNRWLLSFEDQSPHIVTCPVTVLAL